MSVFVNIATQLSLHNCPIESKDVFVNDGNICASFADVERPENGINPVILLSRTSLFGR